jgi:hypothetical protein
MTSANDHNLIPPNHNVKPENKTEGRENAPRALPASFYDLRRDFI